MGQLVVMPKLGLTMKKGKLVKWYKNEGDQISKGEAIFAVETDKISNDIEAPCSGVLRKIIVDEGTLEVLNPVGIIAGADEDISELLTEAGSDEPQEKTTQTKATTKTSTQQSKSSQQSKGRVKASPKARRLAKEKAIDLHDVEGTGPGGVVKEDDVLEYIEQNQQQKQTVKTSPTADKVAEQLDIDVNNISQETRVMKADVIDYWNAEKAKEMASPKEQVVEMNTMREIISERMIQSQEVSAAVNYTLSVDTREMQRLRTQLKPFYKLSYTDIIAKIVSEVLIEYPMLNASVDGKKIIKRNYVNMGIAVAKDDGLIVPVVKYANVKGLKSIAQEIKTLAKKARNNTLEPDEMQGGTFTISNLGMYNIEAFTPIINQPEVAILGINTIQEVPKKIDGELQFIPMMKLSLTADHRIVDGALGAQFLNRVKDYIENPNILLL